MSGEEGNSFHLIGLVKRLLKQLDKDPGPVIEDMTSGSYEHLLEVAEEAVGEWVVFYR